MTDCIVVGGGLIGMLTARYLQDGGADVLVIERGELGREASWAGGGILSPLYPWRYPDSVTALAGFGQARYAELARALCAETGIDPEWTPSGLLILDEEERAQALAWAPAHGLRVDALDAAGLAACEPALAPGFSAGLWFPDIAQVRNPRLVKALKASLQVRGIRFREWLNVEGLAVQGERVTGVYTREGLLSSGSVLVAGGAWSSRLLKLAEAQIDVEPVRGQMIVFKAEPGLLTRIVLYRDRYVIPRRDGRILAGSTLERVGFDKGTTEQARAELTAAARALVPDLAECPVEHHWAGLRPGTPQGVPYIAPHPTLHGLFLNAGHFRNGVVLGLASARLAADLILGRAPALDPTPYRVAAPH